jgi:hypothetical protein
MGKFDVIGDEGHFGGGVFNRATIDSKAQALSDGLGGKKIWFTEVDWQFDASLSPGKMEEIMRTSFANKNIEGLVLWTWVKRRMWLYSSGGRRIGEIPFTMTDGVCTFPGAAPGVRRFPHPRGQQDTLDGDRQDRPLAGHRSPLTLISSGGE